MAYVNARDLEVLQGFDGNPDASPSGPAVRQSPLSVIMLPAGTSVLSRSHRVTGRLVNSVRAQRMPDGQWALLEYAEMSIPLGIGSVVDRRS